MTDKRVVIQTLGCKLNFAESAAMMQQLPPIHIPLPIGYSHFI